MTDPRIESLERLVVDVPDYPKPGIVFKDLTPVFASRTGLATIVELFAERLGGRPIDAVAGIEARGFGLAGALAERLGVGLVLVRKKGKLPRAVHREEYALEYGQDALEIHVDALAGAERVVLVDDVLATGGTAAAASRLVERAGGTLVQRLFVLELGFLDGRARLPGAPNDALLVVP